MMGAVPPPIDSLSDHAIIGRDHQNSQRRQFRVDHTGGLRAMRRNTRAALKRPQQRTPLLVE